MQGLNKNVLDGKRTESRNVACWTEKRNSQFWTEFGQKTGKWQIAEKKMVTFDRGMSKAMTVPNMGVIFL